MVHVIIHWLLLSAAVWLTAELMPGIKVKGKWGAIKVAAVFGLLNWGVGKLLFVMIGFGTLGLGFILGFLTRWVVNAILLKITDAISDSLRIRSFKFALLAAAMISLLMTVGELLVARLG